jgi:predicted nucleic acid-binding protein
MNGIKFCFDTCAIVDFIHRDIDSTPWHKDLDTSPQFVSVIARMEVLSYSGMAGEEELARRRFLSQATVIPLTEAIEEEAIKIRKNTKIRLPDCIIVATAELLGAVLLTSDDQLLKLSWPGFQVLNIL